MKTHKFLLKSLSGCLCTALLLWFLPAAAQTTDTLKVEKNLRNVIKLNVSSIIFYDRSLLLNYERILSPKRSFSIQAGYLEFPVPEIIANNENIHFSDNKKKSGYSATVDYRFYLAKENKYAAPRGIYLAPFVSYYTFKNERNMVFDTASAAENLVSNMRISFFNIGGELGYQFVIKKRWVIDAIMFGPAITSYSFKVGLKGNLNSGDRDEITQDIIDALKEKFPLLNDLSNEHEVSSNGVSSFWAPGFRYSVTIGYRF